jgi:cyclic pyranopterin phosphate synthase
MYCRPTGEGIGNSNHKYNNIEHINKIVTIYKKYGGQEVKLTGGDPVFWNDIIECVKQLKNKVGITKVEIITRSPEILNKIDGLIAAGLDVLDFSVDTLDSEKYSKIVGGDDFSSYIDAIRHCASIIDCKVNSVIMKNITDNEVKSLISFCESSGIKQLKFLDVIDDLESSNTQIRDLYSSLSFIAEEMEKISIKEDVVCQGGLGHPMNLYILPSGLTVLLKNAENGAWYNSRCKDCSYYMCHDALMALRFSTDNTLQFCLNGKYRVDLNGLTDDKIEIEFNKAMHFFDDAYFISNGPKGKSR